MTSSVLWNVILISLSATQAHSVAEKLFADGKEIMTSQLWMVSAEPKCNIGMHLIHLWLLRSRTFHDSVSKWTLRARLYRVRVPALKVEARFVGQAHRHHEWASVAVMNTFTAVDASTILQDLVLVMLPVAISNSCG